MRWHADEQNEGLGYFDGYLMEKVDKNYFWRTNREDS